MKMLQNVKVLDLTRVLAGPFATMILADLGADVLKIERPGTGDDSRSFGPYVHGESGYFMSINRNKKSMTLNLKTERGRDIFKQLIPSFDVVVENFRPGTMDKLGLGYENLKELNPRIIYAAISGFGRTGPYSRRPAYDIVIQALGGLMSITGQRNGQQTRVGASVGDITAGLYGCIGILGGLVRRAESGQGCLIDVAMLDCQVSILENALARYFSSGEVPVPIGNRHPSIVPFESFDASDGLIIIAAGNDSLWGKFCKAVNRPDLEKDERFITNDMRTRHYKDLKEHLVSEIKKKTVDEWCEILDAEGIPCGPVNTIDEVVNHPQVRARNMVTSFLHPLAGEVKIPGNPLKVHEDADDGFTASPILGQDTSEVLRGILCMTEEKIEELQNRGII